MYSDSHSDFQVRYPGYTFYKTGKVFRVLWPELAGDVNQNITIATVTAPFGESVFYKIRWFVVVREGHDCCTCLYVHFKCLIHIFANLIRSIQTYSRRGVPPNKPKHHHAIIYTGSCPPQSLPSEQVAGEPPMGEPIRVIGKNAWNKMDPMSRVNFAKPYTVEHNVKVEDFGSVDPDDEWKLIGQFNSLWHIPGNEALPPATKQRYYDGRTYGPEPATCSSAYPETRATSASQTAYTASSTTQPTYASYGMSPINEDTTPGHQTLYTSPNQCVPNGYPPNVYTRNGYMPNGYASNPYTPIGYVPSDNRDHYPTTETDETEIDSRPPYHRRSGSHRSDRSHGKKKQY